MLLNSTPQPHEAAELLSEYQSPSALIPATCFQRTIIVSSKFSKLPLSLVNSLEPYHTDGFRWTDAHALCMMDLKPVIDNISV